MKKYAVENLRNLALFGHAGAGKTSLAEAMLYAAGATDRLGRTDDGNTVMDWDPEETRRKVSINTSVAPLEWKGCKVNLLDTPGYFDFVGEVKAALRVAEAALLVIDSVAGVEVGTELVYRYAQEAGVPVMAIINKMDRENANFDKALASLEQAFGRVVVPVQVPIGAEAQFQGVVDLVGMKALTGAGREMKAGDIPAGMAGQVEELRERLVESAAEADDELTLKYLEGEALSEDEVRRGLRAAVKERKLMPVFCASSTKNCGTPALLDAIVELVPSPADITIRGQDKAGNAVALQAKADGPLAALVWKTTADPFVGRMTLFRVYSGTFRADGSVYNANKGQKERVGSLFVLRGKTQEAVDALGPGDIGMVAKLQVTGTNDTLCEEGNPVVLEPIQFPPAVYSVATLPKSKNDEEKISVSLQRLAEEDPTISVERSPLSETILSGMGDMHVDVMIERLKRKFGVEAVTATPKIAYRETIRGSAKSEHKHKKQSGGHGQYGHVIIELDPIFEDGQDYEFVDKIVQGRVPQQYRPAVDKGVRETMAEGVLAGYPVKQVRVTLVDGSYHDVDSSEMAFKIAASQAFKKGFMQARPVLLEPIMNVTVRVPENYMGDIIGDLNKKRGRILGMEPTDNGEQIIRAQVPQAEMWKYAIDLRSITQGRGTFAMEFERYEEVPAPIAQPIIEAAGKAAAEG